MDISVLKRDSAAIDAGQWVGDIPGMEDIELRVRGLSSPIVLTLQARKERKVSNKERERDGQLKPEARIRVFSEVLHEAVLLDWRGFTDGGKPIPYDPELARKWCTDRDYEEFADAVTYAARVVSKGRTENQENLEKNSKRSSGGSSAGATGGQSGK